MYTVTRQLQWPDGNPMVEISEGGFDYVNPDMLTSRYPGEGMTYDNPLEAAAAAIDILNQWRRDNPDDHIGIGYGATLGFTAPFEESDISEIREWAQKEYDRLQKCNWCGDIITDEVYLLDGDGRFCSERCAENAYHDLFGDDEEWSD